MGIGTVICCERNFYLRIIRRSSYTPEQSSQEDRLTWFYDPKGVYSVKSGYHVSKDQSEDNMAKNSTIETNWWKTLWNLRFPTRSKFSFSRPTLTIYP